MSVNQAVVFTKPVHHLGIDLTPSILNERARSFLEDRGFRVISARKVTGPELAERDVIKQHYLMYSTASCAASVSELHISDKGKTAFESAFGKSWDNEISAGRVLPTATLLNEKGMTVHQLFTLWNEQFTAGKTAKIQDGLLMAFLAGLDCYCINAFYPAMEANFYAPATIIDYYVVEFDSGQVSWEQFRREVLGVTNAAKAAAGSFRGRLYAEYKVEFPGRDNFVHGSAGPFEGFVERAIHEADFKMISNPVGAYLERRGVSLESFASWKAGQSVSALGTLFDATEEKNTDDVFPILDAVAW